MVPPEVRRQGLAVDARPVDGPEAAVAGAVPCEAHPIIYVIYVYVYVYVCVYIYIYICVYTYTYTCICIYIYIH